MIIDVVNVAEYKENTVRNYVPMLLVHSLSVMYNKRHTMRP